MWIFTFSKTSAAFSFLDLGLGFSTAVSKSQQSFIALEMETLPVILVSDDTNKPHCV